MWDNPRLLNLTANALFGFAIMLFVGSVFSIIGGLLGVVLFRKNAPPDVATGP